MNYRDLVRLVAGGESWHLEFKRKIAHPEKVVREVVAFANTAGGKLLIGVNDNGEIPGVKFPEDHVYALNRAIEELCSPSLDFTVEAVELHQKTTVVIYEVPVSPARPHFVRDRAGSRVKQVFVRCDDKSVKASREMTEIIRRKKKEKDIKFTFGVKEKILMQYLDEHETVTLNTFCQLANLNYYKASKALILLVLANVLKITPTEKGDYYSLK